MKRLLAIAAGVGAAFAVAVLAASLLQLSSLEIPSDFDPESTPREPSRVYSRPLALRTGEKLGADALEAYLTAIAYRKVEGPEIGAGEYAVAGREWRIGARAFRHPTGNDPGGSKRLRLDRNGRISSLRGADGQIVKEAWLEPAVIAVYPWCSLV